MRSLKNVITGNSLNEAKSLTVEEFYNLTKHIESTIDKFTYKSLMHHDANLDLLYNDDLEEYMGEWYEDVFKEAMHITWSTIADLLEMEVEDIGDEPAEDLNSDLHDELMNNIIGGLNRYMNTKYRTYPTEAELAVYIGAVYDAYPVWFKKVTRTDLPVELPVGDDLDDYIN